MRIIDPTNPAPDARTLFQLDAETGNVLVMSPAGLVLATLDVFAQAVLMHTVLGQHLARATGQQIQNVEVKVPVDNPVADAAAPTIGHQALAALSSMVEWNTTARVWETGDGAPVPPLSPELSDAIRALQNGK